MTLLDYYEGMAAMKRTAMSEPSEFRPITPERLRYRYGSYEVISRKKKGAGKGYKENFGWRWRDRKGYMNELRELFPQEYALELCRDELAGLMADMWWNIPAYREQAVREHRERIKAIRLEYGLSKNAVAEFMRVG